MIVDEKKIPKDKSLNSTYNGTDKWKHSKDVIKFTIQNGGASTTDEIPGGGTVKQRIAAQEKQIQSNTLQSTSSVSSSSTIISSSEISILSQSSSEKNHDTQQIKPHNPQSQIARPTFSRNNSNVSASSFSCSAKSRIPKPLSRNNTNTSLFSTNSKSERPKIFKFDIKGKLVVLSKNHPFLEKIKPERKKIPQSYRDAIRIDNLTDDEMDDLSNNYVNKVIAVSKFNLKV